MKTGHFVEGLSNGAALMAAIARCEDRAAPEKCWILVEGEVGYGKSNSTTRIAVLKDAGFVRAKAGWTKHWALGDIATAIGIPPHHSSEKLFGAINIELRQRPRMLFVDEIDHAARKFEILESLRDITDQTESILVAIGMKGARGLMKRYPQIFSRVFDIVTFGPASVDDVSLMCRELAEVKVAPCMVKEIQRATAGRLREVMDCIARVEAFGRKTRETVTLEAYGNRPLLTEDHARVLAARKGANG